DIHKSASSSFFFSSRRRHTRFSRDWSSDVCSSDLVDRYRHDIASIITDTVEKWDAAETTEKIELMVGRDLQYIRLNGTVVGALRSEERRVGKGGRARWVS